jgi:HlyD family secretion protein
VKTLIVLIVLGALAAGGYFGWQEWHSASTTPTFRTAKVNRTEIVSAITATGTVEPEEVVDVGAQVAGLILTFGVDAAGKEVDYGSAVEEGMVLAKIDDSLYSADASQARAQLESARAGVVRSEADLLQLKAKLEQASRDWDRAQRLGVSDALSQSAFDAAKATFDVSKANVSVGEAAILQSRAEVSMAEASVARAERNLGYTVIRSPVKGVIVDRRVNIGQTVVSSLNAPSLFLLAKDLKRIQVWAAVNEADIASIHEGQAATFTVDAYPGRVFKGQVLKIRLNASMTQNVVTYTVEVAADNDDGLLLPYLTANVSFIVEKRENVLAVPNAALRWTPSAELIEPGAAREEPARAGGGAGAGASGKAGGAGGAGGGGEGRKRNGTVWVASGKHVKPISVRVGLSDGLVTEVEGSDLSDDLSVIIGEERARTGATQANTNPFAPQMPRRRG